MNARHAVNAGRATRIRPLAQETGLSASSLYGMVARGEIRAVRIGKALSIPPEEAARLLGMTPPKPEATAADVREAA